MSKELSAAFLGLVVQPCSFLKSTRQIVLFGDKPHVICHSLEVLAQIFRGVVWHDDKGHCPTWTGDWFAGECRCDLGAES
jgi:hypothetical protein